MTGAQLKYEIKKRGYTQKVVAERIGKTPQNLGNILANDDVSSSVMEAIAAAMGVSVADFYQSGDKNIDNECDTRLLDIIQARDRQLDKCQEQLDKLIAILKGA